LRPNKNTIIARFSNKYSKDGTGLH